MLFKYFRKIDYVIIAAIIVLIYIQVYLELEIPGYMAAITTIMTTGGTGQDVLDQGVWMIACAFGSLLLYVVMGALAAYFGTSLGKTLRERQFDQVKRFSSEELGRFSINTLITRSTNDVTQAQMVATIGTIVVIRAPIMVIQAIMKISTKNMDWTLTTVVAIIALIVSILVILLYVHPRFKRIQWLNDDVNRITREGISGIRVVHAYNAEDYQERKFFKANKTLTDTHLDVTRALAFLMPTITLIMNLLTMGIYFIGAVIISEAMGPEKFVLFSDMIVFSSYALQVIAAFLILMVVLMILPRALVAYRRIDAVVETKPSIQDGDVDEPPEGREGEISFKDVSFRYPGASQDTLSDISFDIGKGETVALIGSTGSGKSTLVKLILRFYDVTSGQVLVDGVDVRDYRVSSLNDKLGYVPQKAMLFNASIASNVNYGSTEGQRTEDDMRKAVAIAQGTEFVERIDGQYQSVVSEGATNLSGGQKQRLSIARAVCKRPEIYIFDDSFSALDYKTDKRLRSELRKETSGATTIIVAQRIGTIMDADKIIVLDEGRVVGLGRHKDLLRDCEVYYQIASSQLSDEELMA